MTAPTGLNPRPNGTEVGTTTPSRTPRSGTPIVSTHMNLANSKSHKIQEKQGYKDTRFSGKGEQFQLVVKSLLAKGFIPHELVENEVILLIPSLWGLSSFSNVFCV